MCSLDSDDFWTEGGWKRSVVAARSPQLFDAWVYWVRRHM